MNNYSYQTTSPEEILDACEIARGMRSYLLADQLDLRNVVVTLSLNIPGLGKRGQEKEMFSKKHYFNLLNSIISKFNVDDVLHLEDKAGYIYYFVLGNADAYDLKREVLHYEDKIGLSATLLDIDVYASFDHKISREEVGRDSRKCFLCDRRAKQCAFEKTHTIEELNAYVQKTIMEPIPFTLSSTYIYEDILHQIESGMLRQGDRLVEQKLAAFYGVSRTVVREAIKNLTSFGVVNYRKNSGVEVKNLTKPEIAEILDIRLMFETMFYEDIFDNLNETKETILQLLYRAMQLIDLEKYEDVMLWSRQFNAIMRSLSSKRIAKRLFKKTSDIFDLIRFQINSTFLERSKKAYTEHMNLIQSFLTHDKIKMLHDLEWKNI